MDTKTASDLEYIRATLAIAHRDVVNIRNATASRELGIAAVNLQQAVAAIAAALAPATKVYVAEDSEFVAGLNSGTDS